MDNAAASLPGKVQDNLFDVRHGMQQSIINNTNVSIFDSPGI